MEINNICDCCGKEYKEEYNTPNIPFSKIEIFSFEERRKQLEFKINHCQNESINLCPNCKEMLETL
jgi:hypothetical protein